MRDWSSTQGHSTVPGPEQLAAESLLDATPSGACLTEPSMWQPVCDMGPWILDPGVLFQTPTISAGDRLQVHVQLLDLRANTQRESVHSRSPLSQMGSPTLWQGLLPPRHLGLLWTLHQHSLFPARHEGPLSLALETPPRATHGPSLAQPLP